MNTNLLYKRQIVRFLYFQIIKIYVSLTILLLASVSLIAQEDKNNYAIFCYKTCIYNETNFNNVQVSIMHPITKHWHIGAGLNAGFKNFREIESIEIPYRDLLSSRTDIGILASTQFLFWQTKFTQHFIRFQISANYLTCRFLAEDIRAEHIEHNAELGDNTSYKYTIEPSDSDAWGTKFMSIIQLTYAFEFSFIHLEIGLGYDLFNMINNKYKNEALKVSSSWDDFEKYYPYEDIKPFSDWDCGRTISKLNGLNIVIGIGVRLS